MAVAAFTDIVEGNAVDIQVSLAAIIAAGGTLLSVNVKSLGFVKKYVQNKAVTAWVSGTAYVYGSQVKQAGVIYSCITANSDVLFTVAKWVAVGPVNTPNVVPSYYYVVTIGYITGGTADTAANIREGDANTLGPLITADAALATASCYVASDVLNSNSGQYADAGKYIPGNEQMVIVDWYT
jgi:hypothetical protein